MVPSLFGEEEVSALARGCRNHSSTVSDRESLPGNQSRPVLDDSVCFQSFWRSVLAQRLVNQLRAQVEAAIQIQAFYRKYVARKWYCQLRESIVQFQAHARGYLVRKKLLPNKSADKDINK